MHARLRYATIAQREGEVVKYGHRVVHHRELEHLSDVTFSGWLQGNLAIIEQDRAAGDIADPGPGDLADTAGADQHVGGNVGNRRDHVQIPTPLADQFMGRSERHCVFQRRPQHDLAAVLDEFRNSIMDARQLLTVNGSSPQGLKMSNCGAF